MWLRVEFIVFVLSIVTGQFGDFNADFDMFVGIEIGTDGQVEAEQNTLEINMALQNEERKDHVEALGKAYKAFDDFIIGGITEGDGQYGIITWLGNLNPKDFSQYCYGANNPFLPKIYTLFQIMEDTDIDHLWWDDQFRKLTEIGLANIIVAVLTNIKEDWCTELKYLYENFDELTESLGPIRVIEKVVDQLLRILLTQTDITEEIIALTEMITITSKYLTIANEIPSSPLVQYSTLFDEKSFTSNELEFLQTLVELFDLDHILLKSVDTDSQFCSTLIRSVHALMVEYGSVLKKVKTMFQNEYEKWEHRSVEYQSDNYKIYSSIGTSVGSLHAFLRQLFSSEEVCAGFFEDIIVPISDVYQSVKLLVNPKPGSRLEEFPYLAPKFSPGVITNAIINKIDYLKISHAVHNFTSTDMSDMKCLVNPVKNGASAGAFLHAIGKFKIFLNLLPKIYRLVEYEFARRQPYIKAFYDTIKNDYGIIPERAARELGYVADRIEKLGLCGGICLDPNLSYRPSYALYCTIDCPLLTDLQRTYPHVSACLATRVSTLLLGISIVQWLFLY